ncbi:hypothetical protein [Streptomyces globisporus]|uniref:hypothetical protein n=1 Tax=Streptomyces globisporus TaxID=1908 RepID=UPI0004CB4F09|nr:hypothetical protein [Streptomyces globisporus]
MCDRSGSTAKKDADPVTASGPGLTQPSGSAAAPVRAAHGPAPAFQFNGEMHDTTVAQDIQYLRIDRHGR